MIFDAIVIGAGVSGCAIARELSRYEADILVLEAQEDVCSGTSKANSAIVHAGYDARPGSYMARMNVRGNQMMDELARDLDIPFERVGSLLICTREERRSGLEELLARGEANGVEGLKILEADEVRAIEPNVSEDVVAALYAPTAGIICPFTLTIALAEAAAQNGVQFMFNTRVIKIWREEPAPAEDTGTKAPLWHVATTNAEFVARSVVNAAGLYADTLHNQVSSRPLHITPRRGDYFLLDKNCNGYVKHVVFPQPTEMGKGVLCAPTVHGNVIVGPTAIDLPDEGKDRTATTQEGLDLVRSRAGETMHDLPLRETITSFAGLRAHEDGHEFVLGQPADAPGFFDCAGIESPGLTSAPAIGEFLAPQIAEFLGARQKASWIKKRVGILDPKTLSPEERTELIKKQPAYGQIVCRCEWVTEGEILDAIHRPLGARSLDGLKRRVRVGSGRCQAGFCTPRALEILSCELGVSPREITKCGPGSELLFGRTKEI
ncbi:MAG: NAD(P)/FAD-dependent oxidoreductase [Atopobiaceae bacterium]|jgi:glycerol-3-phosphate dehydrogenase